MRSPRVLITFGVYDVSPLSQQEQQQEQQQTSMGRMELLLLSLLGVSTPNSVVAWNCPRCSKKTRRDVLHRLVLASQFLALDAPSSSARNLPEPISADLSRTGTADALVPILRLRESLVSVERYLTEPGAALGGLDSFLQSMPRDEKAFKSIFDQYSDPISYKQKFVDQNAFLVYYTKGFDGPGRPSIENDLPVKQTIQYGARNDAWVSYDDFLAETDYQKKNSIKDLDELLRPLRKTFAAIEGYLAQAPQVDKDSARVLIENNRDKR